MRWRSFLIGTAGLVCVVGCSSSSDDSDGTAATGGSGGLTGGSGGGTAGTVGTAGSAGSTGGSGGGSATLRCEPYCQPLVGANCAEGPTKEACLLTCALLTYSPFCNDTVNGYLDCTKAATFECGARGEAVAAGCSAQYLAAIDCAVEAFPESSIVVPCQTYCSHIAATNCANDGTEEECNTMCLWHGATETGCESEWDGFLTCANAATFSCTLDYAGVEGCESEYQTYRDCIDVAGGS